jgi:hypothetical protein
MQICKRPASGPLRSQPDFFEARNWLPGIEKSD